MKQVNEILIVLFLIVIITSFGFNKSISQVTNIEGNVYKTVIIGNQEWMAENLNIENSRNGDPIPQVQDKINFDNTYPDKTFTVSVMSGSDVDLSIINDGSIIINLAEIKKCKNKPQKVLKNQDQIISVEKRFIQNENTFQNDSDEYKIIMFISEFETAWESMDIFKYKALLDKDYLYYDKDNFNFNFTQDERIKQIAYLFENNKFINIQVSNIRIIIDKASQNGFEQYANVVFYQSFVSDKKEESVKKTLRIYRGEETVWKWKIFREYDESYVNTNKTFNDAQKAFAEGKYLLVIELLKDFPLDNPLYFEAVALMNQALEKIPRNSNQNFVTISGRVNCGCSKAITGYVVFEDINTRLNVGRCGITSNGYYCMILPTGKIYSYYIDSKDFYPVSRVIDFTTSNQSPNYKDNISIVTYEEMKEKQVSVRINNLFFDFNESKFKSESFLELDRLYKLLNDNYDINIEISGHTDNVGSDSYNITLSNDRANAVKEYLVSKGINSNRIISKGYGKSKPVSTNETDEGRQLNRRVEFKIIKL